VQLPLVRTLVLTAMLSSACAPGSPPLANTQPSYDALASAVLLALAQRDEVQLRALALTEGEFRDLVWPELPAAKPERNLPASYVWTDLRQKSLSGLRRTLAEHGGRRYELLGTRFRETTGYGTYVVHRDSVVTVRDESGAESDISLFGSVLEKDGQMKVFSYVTD